MNRIRTDILEIAFEEGGPPKAGAELAAKFGCVYF
jgi:hypothetical protein